MKNLQEKKIKLVALDMDGTLLNEESEISEKNKKAIKETQSRGIPVVLSTGRNLMTCQEYAKSIELSSYLITVNGSEIWNDKGELVERQLVDTELIEMMLNLSRTNKTKYWAISCDNIWRDELPEDIYTYEWLKFGFDVEDDKVRESIVDELKSTGKLEVSNSSPTNLEVNAVGINKARAIEKVCSYLDISMDEVMAVGDSLNDIAMIKEAGIGVAMGNAQEIVKEAADWTTKTNREDGVAYALEEWVLK